MAKHFLYVALITAAASIVIRLITRNLPITQTWLQEIVIHDKAA